MPDPSNHASFYDDALNQWDAEWRAVKRTDRALLAAFTILAEAMEKDRPPVARTTEGREVKPGTQEVRPE